jgi:hypothetical protein
VESNRDLVPGVWDIPEPDPARCREVQLADVDFALVPRARRDATGYRLGYGAGYLRPAARRPRRRPYCVIALPARSSSSACRASRTTCRWTGPRRARRAMTATIIDGKAIAQRYREELKAQSDA